MQSLLYHMHMTRLVGVNDERERADMKTILSYISYHCFYTIEKQ